MASPNPLDPVQIKLYCSPRIDRKRLLSSLQSSLVNFRHAKLSINIEEDSVSPDITNDCYAWKFIRTLAQNDYRNQSKPAKTGNQFHKLSIRITGNLDVINSIYRANLIILVLNPELWEPQSKKIAPVEPVFPSLPEPGEEEIDLSRFARQSIFFNNPNNAPRATVRQEPEENSYSIEQIKSFISGLKTIRPPIDICDSLKKDSLTGAEKRFFDLFTDIYPEYQRRDSPGAQLCVVFLPSEQGRTNQSSTRAEDERAWDRVRNTLLGILQAREIERLLQNRACFTSKASILNNYIPYLDQDR